MRLLKRSSACLSGEGDAQASDANARVRPDWRPICLALLVVIAAVGMSGAGSARAADPGVVPSSANAYGKSLGEWHAAWWQWAFSFPASTHPLNPASGATCATGQQGHVWFLGGVVNAGGTVTRDCLIPSGTGLVVAVANVECSTLESPPFNGTDEASLRGCAAGVVDPTSALFINDLSASLDGDAINVAAYRAPSPLFAFSVPNTNDNILFCSPSPCSGTSGLAVADGYLLVLHPLSVGTHTLHLGGTFPTFGFTLDITYNLTVVPRDHAT
jgi:hypothetical protein